ncbi:MAG: hypothetical protein GY816_08360 [Cytophagales bacterium]|nr:hypothetical protein [Cytophagales bacterium]
MTQRLDSLEREYSSSVVGDSLMVGFAKVSITPNDTIPLAGYGARDPKKFDQILDSVFVRAVVLDNGLNRIAILSADLLIIHPEVMSGFHQKISEMGWGRNDVFLGATHTHSSIGGWAAGIAGKLFSGKFNQATQDLIIDQMVEAIKQASEGLTPAAMTHVRNEMGVHVKNRLIKDGDEDSWMRNVLIQSKYGIATLSVFSAHATCFTSKSRALSGDFPSYYHSKLVEDSLINFSIYLAGAVGSMKPFAEGLKESEKAKKIGSALAEQVSLLSRIGVVDKNRMDLTAYRLKVPLRPPQAKISENLAMRPWLFRAMFGSYDAEISILKLGNTLMVGLPCDFSGELSVPLYNYASERGLNLIITSFNGGYIGYVTKDDWYDMAKYETRTMNWYGPDSGTYFSEIVKRIIDITVQ